MNKNTLHLDEPFSSEEKNKTRKEDFKLVRELSEDIHRELDYFGLPSPWMRDVAEWINYIDNVTAVELDDHLTFRTPASGGTGMFLDITLYK